MKMLVCHNYYQIRAGENRVVQEEVELLRQHGHEVQLFTDDNTHLERKFSLNSLKYASQVIYSRRTVQRLRTLLQTFQPDIAHVHNTWLQLSPSLYTELTRQSIPTVQTIHNFRWLCIASNLHRDGKVCHDCLEKRGGSLNGIRHRCYYQNLSISTLATMHQFVVRYIFKIPQTKIDKIIVHTPFIYDLFQNAGFAEDKLIIKPNFMRVDNTESQYVAPTNNQSFVYLGRLDKVKGIITLLEAVKKGEIELHIYGDGDLRDLVVDTAASYPNIHYHGNQPHDVCMQALKQARGIVIPSEWYESFPMTFVEATAYGKPVIASDIGSLGYLVQQQQTGIVFPVGNADALLSSMTDLLKNDTLAETLSAKAKAYYEQHLEPENNYDQLINIYEQAIEVSKLRFQ